MNSITNHEVLKELDRVLASANFLNSLVLTTFLKHVVRETIEGRGHELKEYTIAVAALKKHSDFNPQIDSIVRIHAGRLRRALRDYYQIEGVHDPIVIVVPKGSYVPVFELNTAPPMIRMEAGYRTIADHVKQPMKEAEVRDAVQQSRRLYGKPSIFVADFKIIARDQIEIQSSLSEYLSSALTKFDDLVVISREADSSALNQADYVLRGTAHMAGGRMRIFVYLQGRDGYQYWANTFTLVFHDLWQMEDEVVTRTVAAIAGINGVISRVEANRVVLHSENDNQQSLSYWYKQHVNHFDPWQTQSARLYYEDILARMPHNALVAAYLSEIVCRQAFFESHEEKLSLLMRSWELAREALLMDPTCQQAYHAMALITMVLGKNEECIRAIDKGLALNLYSLDFQAGVGSICIYLGEYERGIQLLKEALELLPGPSWGHLLSLAISAFHFNDFKASLAWLEQAKVDSAWLLLVRAAAAANAGEQDVARQALADFRAKYTSLDPSDRTVINGLFILPEMANSIHEALQRLSDAPLFVSQRKVARYGKGRKMSL